MVTLQRIGALHTEKVEDVVELIIPMVEYIRGWCKGKKHRKVEAYLILCDQIDGAAVEEVLLGTRDGDRDYYMLCQVMDKIVPQYTYFGSVQGRGGYFGVWPDWKQIQQANEEGTILLADEWPEDELAERVEAGCYPNYVVVGSSNQKAVMSQPDQTPVWEIDGE